MFKRRWQKRWEQSKSPSTDTEKHNVVCNGVLFSFQEEGSSDMCCSMDKPWLLRLVK